MKSRLSAILLPLVCLLLAACSKSGDSRLFEAVPADAAGAIFAGKSFVDSRQASGVFDEDSLWRKALKDGGLDGMAVCLADGITEPVAIFSLENVDAVRASLTEAGAAKVDTGDDTEVYSMDDEYVLIAAEERFVYRGSPSTPDEKVKFAHLYASAKRNPFGRSVYCGALETKGDLFGYYEIPRNTRGALMAAGVPSEMLTVLEGAVVFDGTAEGPALEARMWLVSPEGEKRTFGSYLPFSLDTSARISKDALAYMGPNISLVAASALKDVNWEEFTNMLNNSKSLSFQQRAMLLMMRPYLEKIDGTVAVGLGVSLTKGQNLTSIAFDPSNLMGTVAIETVSGQAAALSSQIKELIKMAGLATIDTKNGFSCSLPGVDVALSVETRGRLILLSTRPLVSGGNQSPALSVIPFADYISAVALSLPAESPLFDMLPSGAERQDVSLGLGLDAKKSELTVKFVCGRDGSWFDNIIRMSSRTSDTKLSKFKK